MARFCIFCGGEPRKKNLEHIIPKWLIECTGSPKRKGIFGLEPAEPGVGKLELVLFSFNKFQFPACTECHKDYSKFEGNAKRIVDKVLGGTVLTGSDIAHLLDWMDKVRIGLWLGQVIRRKPENTAPNLTINSGIGKGDRILAVYRTNFHP